MNEDTAGHYLDTLDNPVHAQQLDMHRSQLVDLLGGLLSFWDSPCAKVAPFLPGAQECHNTRMATVAYDKQQSEAGVAWTVDLHGQQQVEDVSELKLHIPRSEQLPPEIHLLMEKHNAALILTDEGTIETAAGESAAQGQQKLSPHLC